jgi:8-amino-7-oxononanoate synthase
VGTLPLHEALEAAVAQFKGTEAALTFASGYQANVSVLQALVGKEALILADRLCHASLLDGCQLSGARWQRYAHNDMEDLERKLAQARAADTARPIWLLSESVFSMDGDWPHLPTWVALAERYGAYTLLDEAHATGVLGPQGKGLLAHYGIAPQRISVHMGTFSKALGSQGAYIAGPQVLIDTLINQARGFIYTTALAPAVAAANLAALQVLAQEPQHQEALQANVQWVHQQCLVHEGLRTLLPPSLQGPCALLSPIIPLLLGENATALAWSQALAEQGLLLTAIRPPTVPQGQARLRLALSAMHTPSQLQQLVQALQQCCALPPSVTSCAPILPVP